MVSKTKTKKFSLSSIHFHFLHKNAGLIIFTTVNFTSLFFSKSLFNCKNNTVSILHGSVRIHYKIYLQNFTQYILHLHLCPVTKSTCKTHGCPSLYLISPWRVNQIYQYTVTAIARYVHVLQQGRQYLPLFQTH